MGNASTEYVYRELVPSDDTYFTTTFRDKNVGRRKSRGGGGCYSESHGMLNS